MKKTYIQPSVKAIKLQMTQWIMTNSITVDPNKSTSTQFGRDLDLDEDDDF